MEMFYNKQKGPDRQQGNIKLERNWGPILEEFE